MWLLILTGDTYVLDYDLSAEDCAAALVQYGPEVTCELELSNE